MMQQPHLLQLKVSDRQADVANRKQGMSMRLQTLCLAPEAIIALQDCLTWLLPLNDCRFRMAGQAEVAAQQRNNELLSRTQQLQQQLEHQQSRLTESKEQVCLHMQANVEAVLQQPGLLKVPRCTISQVNVEMTVLVKARLRPGCF